jgi:hypothetical protein
VHAMTEKGGVFSSSSFGSPEDIMSLEITYTIED